MDFEYNGNLLDEDRINLVANEIIKKYNDVTFDKAKEAAMLEGKISSQKTIEDELNRLYNIMLVNRDNKELVKPIYSDFLIAINSAEENSKYLSILDDINEYLLNDREFPFISDYQ